MSELNIEIVNKILEILRQFRKIIIRKSRIYGYHICQITHVNTKAINAIDFFNEYDANSLGNNKLMLIDRIAQGENIVKKPLMTIIKKYREIKKKRIESLIVFKENVALYGAYHKRMMENPNFANEFSKVKNKVFQTSDLKSICKKIFLCDHENVFYDEKALELLLKKDEISNKVKKSNENFLMDITKINAIFGDPKYATALNKAIMEILNKYLQGQIDMQKVTNITNQYNNYIIQGFNEIMNYNKILDSIQKQQFDIHKKMKAEKVQQQINLYESGNANPSQEDQ